jgi:hypothetical protein
VLRETRCGMHFVSRGSMDRRRQCEIESDCRHRQAQSRAQGLSLGSRSIPEGTAVALRYNGRTYAAMITTPQDWRISASSEGAIRACADTVIHGSPTGQIGVLQPPRAWFPSIISPCSRSRWRWSRAYLHPLTARRSRRPFGSPGCIGNCSAARMGRCLSNRKLEAVTECRP